MSVAWIEIGVLYRASCPWQRLENLEADKIPNWPITSHHPRKSVSQNLSKRRRKQDRRFQNQAASSTGLEFSNASTHAQYLWSDIDGFSSLVQYSQQLL